MIMLKWTSRELTTYGNHKWEPGIWYEKPDTGIYSICTDTVFHCYGDFWYAAHMCRADQTHRRFWIAETSDIVATDNQVQGVLRLRLLEEFKLDYPLESFLARMPVTVARAASFGLPVSCQCDACQLYKFKPGYQLPVLLSDFDFKDYYLQPDPDIIKGFDNIILKYMET